MHFHEKDWKFQDLLDSKFSIEFHNSIRILHIIQTTGPQFIIVLYHLSLDLAERS